MLEAGADIDHPNPDGITPLMIAIDNFHYDTARLLLDSGANPHVCDWYGRTALYIAADMSSFSFRLGAAPPASETTALDVIKRLLDAGVNPNPQLNMHRPGPRRQQRPLRRRPAHDRCHSTIARRDRP